MADLFSKKKIVVDTRPFMNDVVQIGEVKSCILTRPKIVSIVVFLALRMNSPKVARLLSSNLEDLKKR